MSTSAEKYRQQCRAKRFYRAMIGQEKDQCGTEPPLQPWAEGELANINAFDELVETTKHSVGLDR
jgi:hypothetical protein